MDLYQYFLLIAIITSIWGPVSAQDKAKLKYFPPFLSIMLLVEMSATLMAHHGINNLFLYNMESLFEFGFYLFFLYSNINGKEKIKFIPYLIWIFLILIIVDVFFIQGKSVFSTYSFILGCIFVSALCLYYFINLIFTVEKISFAKDPLFWINAGILFYHCIMIPAFGISNLYPIFSLTLQSYMFNLISSCNIILYILFSMGFLCKRNFIQILFGRIR